MLCCLTNLLLSWKFLASALLVGIPLYLLLTRLRNKKSLSGQVVLITGASGGIGEALARQLFARGAHLLLTARRLDELERIAAELNGSSNNGGTAKAIRMDVERHDEFGARAKELMKVHGRIDAVVCNAGVSHRGRLLASKREVFERLMSINYFGTVLLLRELLPMMMGSGKVPQAVIVSSVNGKIAPPFSGCYSATKHALQAFADALRAENDGRLSVLVALPGWVRTDVTRNALGANAKPFGLMEAETEAGYDAQMVAARIADAMESDEREVVIAQPFPRLAIAARALWPAMFYRLTAARARRIAPDYD